jgi:hypothetical protein
MIARLTPRRHAPRRREGDTTMQVAGFSKSFAMDQGEVLGNDQTFQALFNAPLTDGKRSGICSGLSMIWAARRIMFHDEDAAQRQAALVDGAGFRWGGRSQDIHVVSQARGGGAGDFDQQIRTNYGDALRTYALRIRAGSLVQGTGTAAEMAADLADSVKEAGTYHLWLLVLNAPTGIVGHMCASYASKGTLGMNRHFYFFDPNMGEYRVGTGDTARLLEGVFDAYENGNMTCTLALAFEVERG